MNYLKSIGYSDSSGDIIDEAMNVQNIYGQMEKELFIKVELDRISDRLTVRGLAYSDINYMTISEQAQVLQIGNLTYSDGMSVYRKVLERLELRKTLMRFIRTLTGYMRRVADCRIRKRRSGRSGDNSAFNI